MGDGTATGVDVGVAVGNGSDVAVGAGTTVAVGLGDGEFRGVSVTVGTDVALGVTEVGVVVGSLEVQATTNAMAATATNFATTGSEPGGQNAYVFRVNLSLLQLQVRPSKPPAPRVPSSR